MRDLPEPEDDFDRTLVANIRRYGWAYIDVDPADDPPRGDGDPPAGEAPFAYTVGVWRAFAHPEVILMGGWRHAHELVANVVSLVEAGRSFAPGEVTGDVLDGPPVRFGAVADERRDELLTYAWWANGGEPFEALQLVLPDGAGRWPWEPGYDAYPQPPLA